MLKLAANLHYLFNDVPFLDRFQAAADAGFKGVEFQVPYSYDKDLLKERLDACGLACALIDTPPGDWKGGERGIGAVLGKEEEFRAGVARAIDYALVLGKPPVHPLAGSVRQQDREAAEQQYVRNLRYAADRFAEHGMHIVIEPINPMHDIVRGGEDYVTEGMRGYFLNHTDHAVRIIEQVDRPNLFLHLDIYHMQMMEGNLCHRLRKHLPMVKHIQIAGVPGRHEPDVGEIHYPFIFDLLEELGYSEWISCEYRPKADTRDGLDWARRFGVAGRSQSTR